MNWMNGILFLWDIYAEETWNLKDGIDDRLGRERQGGGLIHIWAVIYLKLPL